MYHVYILVSERHQRLFIGLSNDPNRRLKEHNAGQVRSTKPYAPYKLVFSKKCASRKEARRIEKLFKTGCWRERINKFYLGL